jgi:hypothetical protein
MLFVALGLKTNCEDGSSVVAAVCYHEGRGDFSQEGIGWSTTCYLTSNLHSSPFLRWFISKCY